MRNILYILVFLSFGLNAQTIIKGSVVRGKSQGIRIGVGVVPDVTPPVINLLGASVINITQNGSYTDPGFVATDDVDGNITGNVVVGGDTVDTSTIGSYVVTYNVSDAAGNAAAQVTRAINVSAASAFVDCTPIAGAANSATSLSDLTGAGPNTKWQINGSINATGATFASGLTIISGSGTISGTNINTNGACIVDDFAQIFNTSVTFSSVYDNSRLSPEAFGANGSDSTADDTAITALILNSQYAKGNPTSIYIKNSETFHDRGGTFDWDMGGCTVRTTSAANLSHGSETSNLNVYLIEFDGMTVNLSNGTWDGENLASRAIKLNDPIAFDYDNLTVFDYFAPSGAYARGVALKWDLQGTNFTGGSITNCDIDNIGAFSDSNANNSPFGVSKAFYFEVFSNGTTPATISMSGNNVNNVYGDDAEGFLNVKGFGGSYNYGTNNIFWDIDGDVYTACERRAFKVNASNVDMDGVQITSVTGPPSFAGAQATLLQIFSITAGQAIENVNFRNGSITATGTSQNVVFGINDADNCLFENNTFTASYVAVQRSITFGTFSTQGGLYDADLSNTVIFRDNIVNNCFVLLNNIYEPVNGGFVFENNTMNIDLDRNIGGNWGTFRIASTSGDTEPHTFTDITININQTFNAGSLFSGVIQSLGRNLKNMTFDNVDVNYTGSATVPTFPWGRIGTGSAASFDSTNTITGNNITGASGTLAIDVTGSPQDVSITDSNGDGATTLTVN